MSPLIKQTLLACGLAIAAGAMTAPASAAEKKPAASADAKKPAAKAKGKAKAKTEDAAEPVGSEPEPDITDTTTTDFECELGNKVTTYHNVNDNEHIAIRWKKRLHRLTRVGTTTGAHRFENKVFGLIWIGIPAKGMLLDSRQNRQLANECKNAEQMKPVVDAPAVVEPVKPAPVAPTLVPAPLAAPEPPPMPQQQVAPQQSVAPAQK